MNWENVFTGIFAICIIIFFSCMAIVSDGKIDYCYINGKYLMGHRPYRNDVIIKDNGTISEYNELIITNICKKDTK